MSAIDQLNPNLVKTTEIDIKFILFVALKWNKIQTIENNLKHKVLWVFHRPFVWHVEKFVSFQMTFTFLIIWILFKCYTRWRVKVVLSRMIMTQTHIKSFKNGGLNFICCSHFDPIRSLSEMCSDCPPGRMPEID